MMDQLYSYQTPPNGVASGMANFGLGNTNLGNAAAVNSITTIPLDVESQKQTQSFKSELVKSESITSPKIPDEIASSVQNQENEEQEFGFLDFLDIINPLQHIPIVSTIYREITGDEIKAPARIFGGMLFGGPSGFVTAIANSIIEETTGQDIGANILEAFLGPDETQDNIQVANLEKAPVGASSFSQNPTTTAESQITAEVSSQLFTQLAPVIPPAPSIMKASVPLTNSFPLKPTNVSNRSQDQSQDQPLGQSQDQPLGQSLGQSLEGQAALAALYNDISRVKNTAAQNLSSQSQKVLNDKITDDKTGFSQSNNPGKWFPLTGENVLIAQAPEFSPIYSQPRSGINKPNASSNSSQQTATAIESEFAQNLLMGLDKYRELKKQ